MRKLALLLLLVPVVLPAGASGAGCTPLDCAPSQFALDGGRLLGTRDGTTFPLRVIDLRTGATRWRLPAGIVAGNTLVHQDGALLTWFDAARGTRTGDALLRERGSFQLVGTSQDGRRAVLTRTQTKRTAFAIVGVRSRRLVLLAGRNWGFDALAGERLYLIRWLTDGYEVRLYDLRANRLAPRPLKSPGESALISGAPYQRLASADGRYLFTLYLGSGGGAMIHELDLRAAQARCIDLPGDGRFDAATTWSLALAPSGRTLWAVSPGYGRAVAIDVRAHRVRTTISFTPRSWTSNPGVAATASDGRVAFTDADHVWIVQPGRRRVVQTATETALALGFAPDGRRLWVVGQRSRVSALRLR